MTRGLFITLEGSDGAGKSTQMATVEAYFKEKGRKVILTREPGGTRISEKLREIVLDKENREMDVLTEMMIYAAARAQHVAERIRPAIERGDVVISDRFTDSSVAYQGYGRELGEQVRTVNRYATDGLEPDLTFFLDIDPAISRKRLDGGSYDRLEQEKMAFHRRVYEGYRAIWQRHPERVIRIDADREIAAVSAEICQQLDRYLEKEERQA